MGGGKQIATLPKKTIWLFSSLGEEGVVKWSLYAKDHWLPSSFDTLLLARLESAYSLIWDGHQVWGKHASMRLIDSLRVFQFFY